MSKVLLSELPEETLLSYEDAHFTVSPSELRQRIANGEELENRTWYVAAEKRWRADAKRMVTQYIESEYDLMYEDWDERAMDCLKQEHYDRIQAILDEAFSGESVSTYWELSGAKVIID